MNARKKHAVVFPGQGSQKTGMGEELFPRYKQQTTRASEIAGFDMEQLCLSEEKSSDLSKTIYTQPCLYWVSLFQYKMLLEKNQLPAKGECVFAGHSLGEYVALCVAGAFDWETGLEIVAKRATFMNEAAKSKEGSMVAVLGLPYEKIKEITDATDGVEIANHNSLIQTVLSGSKPSLEKIATELKQKGAKRVVPLAVSGAFHSSFMDEAAKKFSAFLETIELKPLSEVVYSNTSADVFPSDPLEIKKTIVRQINHSVLWQPLVAKMAADHQLKVEDFHEVGPGNVLTGLIARCL
eukprot:XP_011421932.1 PREDICTED: uncharacterized protein LOC105324531 [Crassostrea gigas]